MTRYVTIMCAICNDLLCEAQLPADPTLVVALARFHDDRVHAQRTLRIYAHLEQAIVEHNRLA